MSNAVVSTEKIVIKPEIIKSDVVLTSAELEQEREKYLKQIQKNISMPGFRPGKVPMGIIKRKYTNTAFYEGFENLLKEKTNEILTQQTFKPLYYVYNFENTDLVQDDGKDKKIELEYLLEPQVDINVKDREIQLVKYGFTESQRKIYSDILILFNFLNENPVEKLEHADQYFVITTEVKSDELSNAEDENKRKKANIPLVIHHYQFQSYGLNELLPLPLEKNKTYQVDSVKWLSILEKNFPDKKQSLIEFLKTVSECNDKQVSISIKDIQAYSELDKYIHPERVKQAFNMDENIEITLETIYNKLSEIIDIVAEYFTGNENNRKINSFIDNLIQVEIPEDFIQKLYKNYVKEEDKKYFSVDLFKVQVIRQIENNILKNILPHVFNPSIDYNKFATNVAKTYLVETLLSQMYVFNLDSTKNYVLHSIQTADSKHREQLLEKYYTRDSVFTYTENVSQDVKVSFQLENINQIHFADFIGMKEDDFK